MSAIIISDLQTIEDERLLCDLNPEQTQQILATGIYENLFYSLNNKIFMVDFGKSGVFLVNKGEQLVFIK
jgi:hypothetical protein